LTIVLLAVSVAITGVSLLLGFPFFFLFLFIPLIPLFGRPRTVKRCPICGGRLIRICAATERRANEWLRLSFNCCRIP